MNEEEQFSDDPIENMKIENEILKLKLKAQYGENFQMFQGDEPLPPEIENQFLKNMINFEDQIKNIELVTVRERLGNPEFEHHSLVTEDKLDGKINEILDLLDDNNIEMGFVYEPKKLREVYEFLTTEFMDLEIEKHPVADMVSNFIYEEFRPNFEADLNENFRRFLKAWLEQNIEDINYLLSDVKIIIGENKEPLNKAEVIKKITNFLDAFESIEEVSFEDESLEFANHDFAQGTVCVAQGNLEYNAVLDNGEKINYKGKVFFKYTLNSGYWDLEQIIIPGFK